MSTAYFTTSEGNFTARLFDEDVPNTVANFVGLAEGTKEWTDPKSGQNVKRPQQAQRVRRSHRGHGRG
jgi:peptidyl-prolyl cis-trans isomerase A (cyclophilin A)